MTTYNPAITKLDMPDRFKRLPVDARGYPVPKFVEWIDGKPDFRVVDSRWMSKAVRQNLCWLCGEQLGRHKAFVIGPMCAINRVNSEPPSHLECARFAVKACPFMVNPARSRNDIDLPTEHMAAPGIPIARNPGAMVIWVTDSYRPFRVDNGVLFKLGEPTSLEWFAHGRRATREEIMHSINTGLPTLRAAAELDGPEGIAAFERQAKRALVLVPPRPIHSPRYRPVDALPDSGSQMRCGPDCYSQSDPQ